MIEELKLKLLNEECLIVQMERDEEANTKTLKERELALCKLAEEMDRKNKKVKRDKYNLQ